MCFEDSNVFGETMMDFNYIDILLIVVIVLAISVALFFTIRNIRNKGLTCGGDCENCQSICNQRQKNN